MDFNTLLILLIYFQDMLGVYQLKIKQVKVLLKLLILLNINLKNYGLIMVVNFIIKLLKNG